MACRFGAVGKAVSLCFAAIALILALLPLEAVAAAGKWVAHEQVRVRLVAAGNTAAPAEGADSIDLGLQFDLSPGWKIYWRTPGDAGIPPSIEWDGSRNLDAVELLWPVPHRFSLFGLETFGYGDEVVFPLVARLSAPGEPLRLRANVSFLICEEICIPYQDQLSLNLPAGPFERTSHAFLIDNYRGQVPGYGAESGLTIEEAVLFGTVEAPELRVRVRSDLALETPDLLVEAPPNFSFGIPTNEISEDGREAVLRVAALAGPADGVLEGKPLTITVTDGLRGIEAEIMARFAPQPAEVSKSDFSALIGILGLALLGGLILNLMPCVLPVLSIKLLSVVGQGGRDRREIRIGFLASAAGIIFSFLVLASGLVVLKAAGMSIGWGIQFQQPLFLAAMAVVVTLFACNLFGFFEIHLPSSLGTAAAQSGGKGPLGSFVTGAFATLLATPCSAPFLGTAVGFALSRGPAEIYAVFAVLGLGLSLPYLLVAVFPAIAGCLPKPGFWMTVLRRVLGVALLATAVWLLSVLVRQVGWQGAATAAALLTALAALLWWNHRRKSRTNVMSARELRFATPIAVVLLSVATIFVPERLGEVTEPARVETDTWLPLDKPQIAAAVAEGKVVFVDVTADWCITCQVNKKLVLENETISTRLAVPNVVTMRGDWTLPSDEISAYLAEFGRFGIPFNAVYGPGAPEGIALPELLTVEAVNEALAQAAEG